MENLEGWNKLVGDKVNVRRRVLPSCVAPFYSSAGVLRGSDDRDLTASWQDFGPCGRQSGVSCQAFQDPYGDEHAGDQPVRREGNGEKVGTGVGSECAESMPTALARKSLRTPSNS